MNLQYSTLGGRGKGLEHGSGWKMIFNGSVLEGDCSGSMFFFRRRVVFPTKKKHQVQVSTSSPSLLFQAPRVASYITLLFIMGI